MARKKFSNALHAKYDRPAKEAVSGFVAHQWGWDCRNMGTYDVDLAAFKEGEFVAYIEVEVRNWSGTGGLCPYSTIHVANRKIKLLENKGWPTYFFALTADLKHAYYCCSEDIFDCPQYEVPNNQVASGEMFYNVPKERFVLVSLETPF